MKNILSTLKDGDAFEVILVVLALFYLSIFAALPIIYTILMSFQEVDFTTLASVFRPFAGLDAYKEVFANPQSSLVFWNTLKFVLFSVSAQVIIGLALALLFRLDFPAASFLRGLFLVGWIMPALVVGAVWQWIFAGDYGVLNHILETVGIISDSVYWLSDSSLSLAAIIIANVWLGIPFNMILLSVGLAAIPEDIYEAAELDGAGPILRFFTITLPMLRATLGAVISLGIILTLQQFDLIHALTRGGPANSSNVAQYWSWSLSFETFNFAQGSAIAVIMIGVVLVVGVIYVRSLKGEQAA